MKNSLYLPIVLCLVTLVVDVNGQTCATWANSPKKDEAETAHTLYRDAIKAGKFADALPNWAKAFTIAPAADGNRDWHYSDGIKIYLALSEKETDAAKKAAYVAKIQDLYKGMIECYKAKGIKIANCNDDVCLNKKISDIKAQQAYDMYYALRSPYKDLLSVLGESAQLGGKSTMYTIIAPYADVAVYQFLKKELSKEDARNIYNTINEISEYNVANNKKFGAYYKDAHTYSLAKFGEIEDYIFDCEYFKTKLEPEYRKDKENYESIKVIYNKLSSKGCAAEDVLMTEIKAQYDKLAAVENAKRKAEFEASNPVYMASKMINEGNFQGAIDKYKEAIEAATSNEEKGELTLSIASVQYRRLGQAASARETARKAAALKPGWGAPYLLIGDMYVGGARNCGDDWGSRLAVLAAIDKYQTAKSVDASSADDANERIGRISSAMPDKSEGFMRGVKDGATMTVPCWIGESVRIRYKS